MKKSYLLLIAVALCFSFLLPRELFGQTKDTNIKYAGVRSSNYGIKPFPSKEEWKNALFTMQEKFEGTIPTAIWIVGVMRGSENMYLEFPSEGKEVKNVIFAEEDKHEPYLKYFDENGIKVFLQVESANADMLEVIDLVLNRYKHHPCVIGFGVDVEWYRVKDNPGTGMKVTDELAEQWEKRVKEHNPGYKIFLKHWDPLWMPPTYRGEIFFVDDSQMLESLEAMVNEFKNQWAAKFYPNPVIFQIGYMADKKWWGNFEDPPKYMGEKIAEAIKDHECGIIWVDFTLKDVVPVK